MSHKGHTWVGSRRRSLLDILNAKSLVKCDQTVRHEWKSGTQRSDWFVVSWSLLIGLE